MTGIEPLAEKGAATRRNLITLGPEVAICNPPEPDELADQRTQETGGIENFDHFNDRQFTLQLTTA